MLQLEESMHYKTLENVKKFKYELLMILDYDVSTFKALLELNINHKYFKISNGIIRGKEEYRWDGPSGPTKDDKTNLRASLFHDIGYQAMREFLKNLSWWKRFKIRRAFDKMFKKILIEDGMGFIRRQYYFIGVRGLGAFFTHF